MSDNQSSAWTTIGAVDIGSNTVHLVVARTDGEHIDIVADEKEMLRLGDDVSFEGEISAAKYSQTLRLLAAYRKIAQSKKANFIVTGTEPLRAAHNAAKLVQQAKADHNVIINVLSQDEEAILSFRGATHGMSLPNHFLVADIGGGSTEIILVSFNQIQQVVKLPVGGIKLRAISRASDPPTETQVFQAQFRLGEIFGKADWPKNNLRPHFAVLAGGNAKAVTRLFNRGRRAESLRRSDIQQAVSLALSKPSETLAQEYNLVPSRAQTFGMGALIMAAIMDKFNLETVVVSKYGIREGILLTYAYYGEHWRASLTVSGR